MKILFIAPRFHTNQSGLVRSLISENHEVSFIVSNIGITEDHSCIIPNLATESICSKILSYLFGYGGPNKKRFVPKIIPLVKMISHFRPDVVVIRYYGRTLSLLSATIARLCGAKVIFYQQASPELLHRIHHGSISCRIRKLKFDLKNLLFQARWATPILNSRLELPDNHIYIPFVVKLDDEDKLSTFKTLTNSFTIIMVSKFTERKNHQLLLDSLYILSKNKPNLATNIKVVFVGEKSTREHQKIYDSIIAQCKSTVYSKYQFSFYSNIKHSEIYAFYQTSDLFVLPASNEPCSVSLIEAMGYGLPVVCSSSCGNRNHVQNNYNGFIFKDKCAHDLALTIEKVISNKANYPVLCKNSYYIAQTFHSIQSASHFVGAIFAE